MAHRISIAHRLYFVVGIMGLLILLELVTLRFAMTKLSAVRAFVGGEALWSKAQKNSLFSLQRYASTRDERDFQLFLDYLSIPEGDRRARLELQKPNPDLNVVREGFVQGKIHPEDIDPMIDLLLRLYWVSHLDRAITAWTKADQKLESFSQAGREYREALLKGQPDRASALMERVKVLNEELTVLEEEFSAALGEGSRYLETVVLTLLTIAVVMVEGVGLTLAVATARSISRGLQTLNAAAEDIGKGKFENLHLPKSRDEIGALAESVARMGAMLKKSYSGLESRVHERTAELAALATENARLYEEASAALRRRDEFLSLASHEIKTPLTSMLLQAQMLSRGNPSSVSPERLAKFSAFMERELHRLNLLVEEMLDTSRIDLSKLTLRTAEANLSSLVLEICQRFQPQFQQAAITLETSIEPEITAPFDSYRIEQVLTNLLSNALKYAPHRPVRVCLEKAGQFAELSVRDHGTGVAEMDRERIFNRFERGVDSSRISGLGIGLYISKAIVLAHGGTIEVKNPLGGGAEFVVRLPLA